ncbi:MAG: hypothetical protein E6Q95_02715 [Chitinophagaceae bacterium]|nr:MAG: hypothetical protein E6Q95_02715 [Chitinophagaceae bacterium]
MRKTILTAFAVLIAVAITFAQCPTGALNYTGQLNITSGQTYCLSSNLSGISGNLKISNGGKLVINSGVVLEASGSIIIEGELELRENAGVKLIGGMTLGSIGNFSSTITLGKTSYISMTGALTQYDATFSNFFPTRKAVVKMDNGSVVEVCGTYSHFGPYNAVEYTGTPTSKAFFINKAEVSGTVNSPISASSNIRWIALKSVADVVKNQATYCGPNATAATCSNWPGGLTDDWSVCNQAPNIINNYLAVSFGTINASLNASSNQLNVQWQSAIEENNNYYEVEVSTDGNSFTSLGKVKSKAQNGNSNTALNYEFSYSNTNTALGAVILLSLLAIGFTKRKSMIVAMMTIMMISIVAVACSKNSDVNVDSNNSVFVRLKQVDLTGAVKYSKVVKAEIKN